MSDKTKIEWTDATWNPIRGCSVVSEGCRVCYAMKVAARFSGKGQAYEGLAYRNTSGAHWTGKVRLIEEHLDDPLRWQRPRRIFVNSMSDLFHESIPDEHIEAIFGVMATAGHHIFQVLTKRPKRMLEFVSKAKHEACVAAMIAKGVATHSANGRRSRIETMPRGWPWPLPNVWLGVSVEDQKTADERIPLLLKTPAAVRWISAEPLLGHISLFDLASPIGNDPIDALGTSDPDFAMHARDEFLDWVVVGGESGDGARPMHRDWARSIRDQCTSVRVPFFFKQWGEFGMTKNVPREVRDKSAPIVVFPDGHTEPTLRHGAGRNENASVMWRVGKHVAGRVLDGRTWNGYPEL